jgi:hypothetical protein
MNSPIQAACVVEQGGSQHAGDDGPGFAKTTDEQQGQQLCLVADLGDGNADGGG